MRSRRGMISPNSSLKLTCDPERKLLMSALALLSTNNHDIAVNTEAAKKTLTDQLDSLSVVTSYAHAIGNTYINPVSSEPEPWVTTLTQNLHVAKTHALDWIGNVGPLIGSRVPQSIINFNNVFLNATQQLLTIIPGQGNFDGGRLGKARG